MWHDKVMKATAVAELMAGLATDEIAERYGIPEGTCRRWRAEQRSKLKNGRPGVRSIGKREKEAADHLREIISALVEQQRLAADMSVHQAALIVKASRLLEAASAEKRTAPAADRFKAANKLH